SAAIRAKRRAGNPLLVAREARSKLAGGQVPKPDTPVFGARREGLAVGAERHGVHRPVVPRQSPLDEPGGGVPDPDGIIGVARGDRSTVGAPGHAGARDSGLRDRRALEDEGLGRMAGVPSLQHSVVAARGEGLAVGNEGIPAYGAGLLLERAQLAARV